MKRLRKIVFAVVRTLVFVFCGFMSVFLLMTGYESTYNRDLPLVHSLDQVDLTPYQKRYDLRKYLGDDAKNIGNFGKPINVKMPQRSMQFDVVAPIAQNSDQWLARASTLHLVPLSPARNGNVGVILLYCRSSFRTFDAHNMPKAGDNVFIDTDRDWRYVYRVTATRAMSGSEPHIISDNGTKGKLIISCHDQKAKVHYIVEADQLVVQGVAQ